MSHVHHELAEEFPDLRPQIDYLKTTNTHFARLAEKYHTLNREIHRVEAAGINVGDAAFEDLKKERLALKDQIFALLKTV